MLLEMRNIVKSFHGIEILKSVSFALKGGQIHALVGHNGAGKSTLMKVLGGLYPDYGGAIKIEGQPLHLHTPALSQEAGVAAIYQDFSLVPTLSVGANIALGREPKTRIPLWLNHSALRARSMREAERLGIHLPMDALVRDLGVAMQQMTEIVRSLSQKARILIMDEPTARLAPAERAHLFTVMRRMAQDGLGIIYISHFLEEVVDLADHVTVLRDGSVICHEAARHFSVDDLTHLLVGDQEKTPSTTKSPKNKTQATPSQFKPGQTTPVLELKDFIVGHDKTKIKGSSLKIYPGEIVGLAGLVGSGRTRLARALVGDIASHGTIKMNGHNLRPLHPQKAVQSGIILLPEDRKVNGLVLTATVQENLQLTALANYLSHSGFVRFKKCRELTQQALTHFHIKPPQLDRQVNTLSGGNAQKVLLARAVLAKPHILILDQPTAGVDIGAKAELHKQIQELAAQRVGILLISDDLDELLDLSNRIAIIVAGVVQDDTDNTGKKVFDRAGLLSAISRHDMAA